MGGDSLASSPQLLREGTTVRRRARRTSDVVVLALAFTAPALAAPDQVPSSPVLLAVQAQVAASVVLVESYQSLTRVGEERRRRGRRDRGVTGRPVAPAVT